MKIQEPATAPTKVLTPARKAAASKTIAAREEEVRSVLAPLVANPVTSNPPPYPSSDRTQLCQRSTDRAKAVFDKVQHVDVLSPYRCPRSFPLHLSQRDLQTVVLKERGDQCEG